MKQYVPEFNQYLSESVTDFKNGKRVDSDKMIDPNTRHPMDSSHHLIVDHDICEMIYHYTQLQWLGYTDSNPVAFVNWPNYNSDIHRIMEMYDKSDIMKNRKEIQKMLEDLGGIYDVYLMDNAYAKQMLHIWHREESVSLNSTDNIVKTFVKKVMDIF